MWSESTDLQMQVYFCDYEEGLVTIMLRYYKQTLLSLFRSIQTIAESPWDSLQEVYAVQYALVRRISYVERKIQALRAQERQLKKALTVRHSTEQARAIKDNNRSSACSHRELQTYQACLLVRWRCLGVHLYADIGHEASCIRGFARISLSESGA